MNKEEKFTPISDLYDSKVALKNLMSLLPKKEDLDQSLDTWILRFVEENEGKIDRGISVYSMAPKLPYDLKRCISAIYHTAITNVLVDRGRILAGKEKLVSTGPYRFLLSDSYREERKSE